MSDQAVFVRVLQVDDKGGSLVSAIDKFRNGVPSETARLVRPGSFCQVPGSPFAYWVDDRVRSVFARFEPFESNSRLVRQGGVTGDDDRYLRGWWEAPTGRRVGKGSEWVPFAKGGNLSQYWADLPIVVHWDFDRGTFLGYTGLKHRPSLKPSSADLYFRRGLTWPLRASRFAPIPLPEGSIFSIRGYSILAPPSELPSILAIGNSKAFDAIFKLALGRSEYPEFVVGVLQRLPMPHLPPEVEDRLGQLAMSSVEAKRLLDTGNEISHVFRVPTLLRPGSDSIPEAVANWEQELLRSLGTLECNQAEIDEIASRLYGMLEADQQGLEASFSEDAAESQQAMIPVDNDETDKPISTVNLDALVADLVSYTLGAVLGRWDVRIALDSTLAPKLQGPFDPMPACSPGMLVGLDGLPAKSGGIVSKEWLRARPDAISIPPEGSVSEPTIPDSDYPLRIDWDGILVEDSDHPDDVVRRVREVLHLLWGDRADEIEAEAAGILGVKGLRDYFRNPKHFWDFHVKRYSKSRRKAPIYWLLQSPKRNYALWLYYHRLDPDILFKALVNYVEPKIRLEEDRLSGLGARRQTTGAGSETRRLEKAIDQQEALLSDLHEFRDRLDRAARLHLRPDLDDGVLLNIAPLWELVPWKEAKRAWDELLVGKYEWSAIAKQLRERGLV